MDEISFDEFASFIREWSSISHKKLITFETQFEFDLGITGDDGADLLEAVEKRFDISLITEEGFREKFKLAPDEYLFHAEGGPSLFGRLFEVQTIFGNGSPTVKAFTVGELYVVVQEAVKGRIEESAARRANI
jgi:acyl carrier protein